MPCKQLCRNLAERSDKYILQCFYNAQDFLVRSFNPTMDNSFGMNNQLLYNPYLLVLLPIHCSLTMDIDKLQMM